MTIIRVEFAPGFRGEDVVLLAMDAAGVVTFAAALKDAAVRGTSQLQHGGVTHEFLIQADAADIKLGDISVVWRLDPVKAVEIIEDLEELSGGDRPGHHYVRYFQAHRNPCPLT